MVTSVLPGTASPGKAKRFPHEYHHQPRQRYKVHVSSRLPWGAARGPSPTARAPPWGSCPGTARATEGPQMHRSPPLTHWEAELVARGTPGLQPGPEPAPNLPPTPVLFSHIILIPKSY